MKNKNNYRIVVSDLDGTLLGKDQTVSKENLKAIAEMHRLGVHFVLATGRALSEIPKELIDSDGVRYIITSDGAAVWDKLSEKMIISRYIPKELTKLILDTVYTHTAYTVVHENGKAYRDAERHSTEILDACHINKYFCNLILERSVPQNEYYEFVSSSDAVEMFCIFFESDDARRECKRIFLETGKLCVASSGSSNLEIYFSEAGKGNALKALLKKLEVNASQAIAVGDSSNDYTLIKAAGLGLATENACDELKAMADKTICKNSEHIAKHILENYILEN